MFGVALHILSQVQVESSLGLRALLEVFASGGPVGHWPALGKYRYPVDAKEYQGYHSMNRCEGGHRQEHRSAQ